MLGTGGTYTSHAILGNTCAYDAVLGLKTSSSFWSKNPNNSLQFVLDRTEIFGYDPHLDYLTNASYNDGMPNPTQSWTYDAAGNRSDAVCDNLNRAASIGGVACTNDILGNRLTKGSTSYTWDDLNRMAGLSNSSFQTSYVYRADGMRASKTGFDGEETRFTRYRYDGQMGIEDYETRDNNQVNGVRSVLTQYGLGARGIDYIRTTTVTGTGQSTLPQTDVVDGYPIYDAHGNMVATLSKSGQNDYALSNQRSFDAWGNVRIGSASGNPTGRYCANIGHKQDDESGLVYMRARYYEPTSGRFVSQDNQLEGTNWFRYCGNDPVNQVDRSGCAPDPLAALMAVAGTYFLGAVGICWVSPGPWSLPAAAFLIATASACIDLGLGYTYIGSDKPLNVTKMLIGVLLNAGSTILSVASSIATGLAASKYARFGAIAVLASAAYATICLGYLIGTLIDETNYDYQSGQ